MLNERMESQSSELPEERETPWRVLAQSNTSTKSPSCGHLVDLPVRKKQLVCLNVATAGLLKHFPSLASPSGCEGHPEDFGNLECVVSDSTARMKTPACLRLFCKVSAHVQNFKPLFFWDQTQWGEQIRWTLLSKQLSLECVGSSVRWKNDASAMSDGPHKTQCICFVFWSIQVFCKAQHSKKKQYKWNIDKHHLQNILFC